MVGVHAYVLTCACLVPVLRLLCWHVLCLAAKAHGESGSSAGMAAGQLEWAGASLAGPTAAAFTGAHGVRHSCRPEIVCFLRSCTGGLWVGLACAPVLQASQQLLLQARMV